jgi:hypothetical protein
MQSKYFGFKKFRGGGMVFGKDLNEIIDDLDDKLHQALGAVVEAGAKLGFDVSTLPLDGAPPLPGAWTQVAFDDEVEIIFPTAIKLGASRIIVYNDDTSGGAVQVAFALASAPTTPITTMGEFDGSGLDVVLDGGGTEVDADEEIILIARNKVSAAITGTPDIQVSVEGNKVLT